MEFDIKKHEVKNKFPKEALDIAYKFSANIHREIGPLIKAIILFGSAARRKTTSNDIDILIILDDTEFEFTKELIETYRIICQKVISNISFDIHLTSLKFTNFWEYTRVGDPLVINILREGQAIIDKGFVDPLQRLLREGRIRPTPESVHSYLSRSPQTIVNSKWHLLQAGIDLYWAVIDSAHAVLMSINEIPPTPEHVADLMDEKLIKNGLLEKKYSTIMRRFYKLNKLITNREIKELTGHEYDLYLREAIDFGERMTEFIDKKYKFENNTNNTKNNTSSKN